MKICLIQDGIYASLARTKMSEALESAQWFTLADDLQLRGFKAEDLRRGVQILDYAQLVQMMMSEEQQVLGAF
ncbi:MAG: DsrH/TusB family sulfur metabolism protein [Desulfitobacteriaceae bacterium]